MAERRINWKANIGKAARNRHDKKLELLSRVDEIREKLKTVNVQSSDYDKLLQEKRELSAKIATL